MRLKLIACKVLCREISRIAADSENYIDISYLRENYHNEPKKLHDVIQREIDRIDSASDCHTSSEEAGKFDAILLGFGLCSNAAMGLMSHKYPIIMPRAHDCMTFLLGSASRYREIFDECSGGVYWYTCGKMENELLPSEKTEMINYRRLLDKYGSSNASYLIGREKMALLNYKKAAFVDTGVKSEKCEELAKKAAEYYGWKYEKYSADLTLLKDFLGGSWDNERFLKVPPMFKILPSYDETVIKAEKSDTI